MTDVEAGFKIVDATKVFRVGFKGGVSVVLARAGSIEGSDMFHTAFEELAADTEITSERTIADTANRALLDVRNRLQSSLAGSLLSLEQKQRHITDRGHSFLLAYAFKNAPCLLEGNSNRQTVTRVIKPPTATGSGAYVALSALKGIDTEALSFQEGVGWAAYAVEMAKESDAYCSGPTQIGAVAEDGNVDVFDPELGESVNDSVTLIVQQVREQLGAKIRSAFKDVPVPLTDEEEKDWLERELQKHLKRAKR